MTEMLFYRRPVALNRLQHAGVGVLPPIDFAFASEANAVILVGMELSEAARYYPIVFTRSVEGDCIPVAIVGLRRGENQFVARDGSWDSAYCPAFVRRFPFVLAGSSDPERFFVCVDGDYLVDIGTPGSEPLFDAGGGESAYLRRATAFMQQYNQQYQRTLEWTRQMLQRGMLTGMRAVLKQQSDDRSDIDPGRFLVLDEERLRALDAAAVEDWFRAGWLAWCHAHLISLGHFPGLAARLPQTS